MGATSVTGKMETGFRLRAGCRSTETEIRTCSTKNESGAKNVGTRLISWPSGESGRVVQSRPSSF